MLCNRAIRFFLSVSILNCAVHLSADDASASKSAVKSLQEYLARDADKRSKIDEQAFAKASLTKDDAAAAEKLLVEDHAKRIRAERAEEMKARKVTTGKM